jgi:hypothetical protein
MLILTDEGIQNMAMISNVSFTVEISPHCRLAMYSSFQNKPNEVRENNPPSFFFETRTDANSAWHTSMLDYEKVDDLLCELETMMTLYRASPKPGDYLDNR